MQVWEGGPEGGVEEGSKGQAIRGPRYHTGEFQLSFSLGQWRAIERF